MTAIFATLFSAASRVYFCVSVALYHGPPGPHELEKFQDVNLKSRKATRCRGHGEKQVWDNTIGNDRDATDFTSAFLLHYIRVKSPVTIQKHHHEISRRTEA